MSKYGIANKSILMFLQATDLYFCGLATNFCVGYSAVDAQNLAREGMLLFLLNQTSHPWTSNS
jgi:nicotinamidase-related amidase